MHRVLEPVWNHVEVWSLAHTSLKSLGVYAPTAPMQQLGP